MNPCNKCSKPLDDEWISGICTPCWYRTNVEAQMKMLSLLHKLGIKR